MILTAIPNHLHKSRKTNDGKASAIKSRKKHQSTTEKTAQPPQHIRKNHETTTEKTAQPPKHIRKNRETTTKNHLATKAQLKKLSEYNLPTQCNHQS
jgi:hypothetical protein